VSYGNHDHAPLAATYARFREQLREPSGDLANLLAFARWEGPPPAELNSELLSSLQKSLFETPCLLAVLMCTDLIGTAQRFNLPGSYGSLTWCERMELPWQDMERHPLYGPRIQEAEKWLIHTGRA